MIPKCPKHKKQTMRSMYYQDYQGMDKKKGYGKVRMKHTEWIYCPKCKQPRLQELKII